MNFSTISTTDYFGKPGVPLLLLSIDCVSAAIEQLSQAVDHILEINNPTPGSIKQF